MADNYLLCDNGDKIHSLEMNPSIFLNKLMLLYGDTGSGKSTLLTDILFILKDIIAVPIVFSPSNEINGAFNGIIPKQLIYNEVNLDKLQDIWDAQKKRARLYKIANDFDNLKGLFKRVATYKERMKELNVQQETERATDKLKNDKTIDHGRRKAHITSMTNKMKNNLKYMYKNCIRNNIKKLNKMGLKKREHITIDFMDMNPNMIIIFDDCMPGASAWKNEKILKDLFFTARHYFISQIYTLQDNHSFPTEYRKNAMFSMFTSSNVATSFFDSSSNGIMKCDKKTSNIVIPRVFNIKKGEPEHHQKLVYDKVDPEKFKFVIADTHDTFRVGSPFIWRFLDKIPKKKLISSEEDDISLIYKY